MFLSNNSSRVETLNNSSLVETLNNSSRVETLNNSSRVENLNNSSQVETLNNSSQIETLNNSSQVETMFLPVNCCFSQLTIHYKNPILFALYPQLINHLKNNPSQSSKNI
jgi:hypothetical protein